MKRRTLLLLCLLVPVFTGVLPGCGEDCAPVDFAGGSQCGGDRDTVVSCQYDICIEGPVCREGWFLHESNCPSYAPTCVEHVPNQATCVGEIVGTCSAAGIVSCEDAFTEIRCADDGKGGLALQRGACGPGARCRASGGPNQVATGCDPRF